MMIQKFFESFSQIPFCKVTRETTQFSKRKRKERPKNLFEVKILLDTGLYSKNAQLSSLAFLFLVLPYNPHKLDWLFASVPHSIQVVPKKALYFLSIWAQSRCDPDLDHISIGPGLKESVTLFFGHPVLGVIEQQCCHQKVIQFKHGISFD